MKIEFFQGAREKKDAIEMVEHYMSFADFAAFPHTDSVIIHKDNHNTRYHIEKWKERGIDRDWETLNLHTLLVIFLLLHP